MKFAFLALMLLLVTDHPHALTPFPSRVVGPCPLADVVPNLGFYHLSGCCGSNHTRTHGTLASGCRCRSRIEMKDSCHSYMGVSCFWKREGISGACDIHLLSSNQLVG